MRIASTLLSLALVLFCCSSVTAYATNQTSGSTDVSLEYMQATSPDIGGGDTADNDPSYSYQVNIPASFALTSSNNSFQITASDMNIPADKELVVRINGAETFENDGNFYLFLDGDKTSEHWILCYICRIEGYITSYVTRENTFIASFDPGRLKPNKCDSVRLEHALFDDVGLVTGTYTGTIYYTIGLE